MTKDNGHEYDAAQDEHDDHNEGNTVHTGNNDEILTFIREFGDFTSRVTIGACTSLFVTWWL